MSVSAFSRGHPPTAGVGVMPDSDPARELEETELKFKALLTALV